MNYPEALSWLIAGARIWTPISINLGWDQAAHFARHHDVSGMRALRTWAFADARRYPAGDMRREARVLLARLLWPLLRELTMTNEEAAKVWGFPSCGEHYAALRRGAA